MPPEQTQGARERRVVLSWYNRHGRSFPRDNGVRWVRVHIRLRRWHEIGGFWWSRPPAARRFRVLLPQAGGPKVPLRHARFD